MSPGVPTGGFGPRLQATATQWVTVFVIRRSRSGHVPRSCWQELLGLAGDGPLEWLSLGPHVAPAALLGASATGH